MHTETSSADAATAIAMVSMTASRATDLQITYIDFYIETDDVIDHRNVDHRLNFDVRPVQ